MTPTTSRFSSRSHQDESRRLLRTLMNMNGGFVKLIDSYAIVLVLLATITYPTFSQPPGSFDEDGLMRTSGNPRLAWFVYLNSFSFFFSVTDLLLCLSGKYAPMANLRKADPKVERGDPKSQKELGAFNDKLAHSVLFTLTKLLVINVLFVLSLTCCITAYVSAGFAVLQPPFSNQLSIIIPCIGGGFLYCFFVVWLLIDFTWFFGFATSGSIVECLSNFGTMIWFFIFQGCCSSCTQQRFRDLAKHLAATASLWRVQQLFNKASDEMSYDQVPASSPSWNTPAENSAKPASNDEGLEEEHDGSEEDDGTVTISRSLSFSSSRTD